MTIKSLLKLNESRAMQLAMNVDKDGNTVENTHLACLDCYTFIRKREYDYCIINIDPNTEETTNVSVPSAAISDTVKTLFE